jgi:hypothetical protein
MRPCSLQARLFDEEAGLDRGQDYFELPHIPSILRDLIFHFRIWRGHRGQAAKAVVCLEQVYPQVGKLGGYDDGRPVLPVLAGKPGQSGSQPLIYHLQAFNRGTWH